MIAAQESPSALTEIYANMGQGAFKIRAGLRGFTMILLHNSAHAQIHAEINF